VAGDLTRSLLRQAQRHYEGGTRLVNFDAHQLPFADRSFDVVILFEAIYYLSNPERFFQEAHRLLNEDGILVICSANPERRDFSPSPMSHRYFAAGDFREILHSHGFRPSVYGAFPTRTGSMWDTLVYLARRVAIALRVIPKTMRGKVWLKRLVYGRLVSIKPEVDDGPAPVLTPVTTKEAPDYKVIYAVGRRVASDGMDMETGS
jgi:SAM-dependent methyltransferase